MGEGGGAYGKEGYTEGIKQRVSNRTRGLYLYSISPFYQRPFAGYLGELTHVAKAHFLGSLVLGTMALGAWSVAQWANHEYHRLNSKEHLSKVAE